MKKYVPRWLYSQKLIVPASEYFEVDSGIFANDSMWPFHPEWMSVVSMDASPPVWGGAPHQMAVALSLSGFGGLFPNPVSMAAIFAAAKTPRVGWSPCMNPGAGFTFTRDVVVPPGTGIRAECFNAHDEDSWFNPTALFKAVTKDELSPEQDPVILADRWPDNLTANSSKVLRGAGLVNNGRDDVILKHLNLSTGCWGYEGGSIVGKRYDTLLWHLNPTTGVQWMPDPSGIPVGLIAPYNRYVADVRYVGPRVMEFADDIVMYPTQQLEVELYSDYTVDVALGMCLFGYLEVE